MRRGRCGFTLLELLVVIGIIALLLALGLAWLVGSRRSATQVACAANLQQLHHAFDSYAVDFHGAWPVELCRGMPDSSTGMMREWHWFDYLSGYVGPKINADGTEPAAYRTLENQRSVLWGCPSRAGLVDGAGYAMNPYPLGSAHNGLMPRNSSGGNEIAWVFLKPVGGSGGRFFNATEWRDPSSRCLLYDSIAAETTISWPWWVGKGSMPAHAVAGSFTPDFNRHPKRTGRVPQDQPALNVLFCDGHVDLVSARGTWDTFAVR